MGERAYQYEFSSSNVAQVAMFDVDGRNQKARKILAVLKDYFGNVDSLSLLDVGASTGIISGHIGREFKRCVGLDIDKPAIEHACRTNELPTASYLIGDGLKLCFRENSFDAVICNQVYEHVPNSDTLMKEIFRVLRPGGVCYFGANNRLKIIETHYGRLPFLSYLPKPLAHLYLRALGRAKYYYETHFTYWGLKRLVARFEVIDYTKRIVEDPERYHATDTVAAGSFSQKCAVALAKTAYWFFPGYVWLLKKPTTA